MLEIKTMPLEQFMKTDCNEEQLKGMYNRLSAIPHSKWAPRLYYSSQPLYEASGRIYGGGDCWNLLSYREGYGYTIIDVGDRGDWMCCVYPKPCPKLDYKYIAFYDGEFEEIFEKLAERYGKRESEKTWNEKLADRRKKAWYSEKVNRGITDKETENLTKAFKKELKLTIPMEYIMLLKLFNGLEMDAKRFGDNEEDIFILYGADEEFLLSPTRQSVRGLLDMNRQLHKEDWRKKYIFLGENAKSWYAYEINKKKCHELCKPSGDVFNTFESFDDMAMCILEPTLFKL